MAIIGAVINSESGPLHGDQAKARFRDIEENLRKRVAPDFWAIVPGGQIEEEIRRLLSRRIDILAVGGGDGTVSTGASLVAGEGVTLAVVALGTRNHFARDLNLPLDPAEAIRVLDGGKIAEVDLGEVNGRLFMNNASVGFYPKVVRTRDQTMLRRGWRKWPAAAAAALAVFRRNPQLHLVLEVDGHQVTCRTPFLFVGNNEYRGGLLADSMRPSLAKGTLWICTTRASNFLHWAGMIWQGSIQSLRRIKNLDCQKATEMTVHFRQPRITVAIDGENQVLDTPLRFAIRPKRLKVLVP